MAKVSSRGVAQPTTSPSPNTRSYPIPKRPYSNFHRIFGLGQETPEYFVRPQWPFPQIVYFLYTIFWMIYIPTWALLEGVLNFHLKFKDDLWKQATFFIYLTNWTYILLSLLVILRGIAVCWYCIKRKKQECADGEINEGKMPTLFKVIWVIYNIVLPAQVIVGGVYYFYAIFFGGMDRTTPLTDPMNINIHGIATLYVLTDLVISAIPLKPGHVIHVVFYGLLYAAFTGIYFACGGKNKSGYPGVYRLLDWRQPKAILLAAVAACVATPMVWFTLYGIYRLKKLILKNCKRTKHSYSMATEMVKETGEQKDNSDFKNANSCDISKIKDSSSILA